MYWPSGDGENDIRARFFCSFRPKIGQTAGPRLISGLSTKMEQLSGDCIFEIMKHLGPDNIAFMLVCKRFWAIFEKNRAGLELLRARLSSVKSSWNHEVHSLELSNVLYPNKKIFIEDCGYGDAVRDSEKRRVDKYRDVKLSPEVLKKVIFTSKADCSSFYISTLSRNGRECYSFMVYREKNGEPHYPKCMVYNLSTGSWIGGMYPINTIHTGIKFWHIKDDVIRVSIGDEVIWCYDFGEYARICKHILKFPELPPEILQCYKGGLKYLVECTGPPEAMKML